MANPPTSLTLESSTTTSLTVKWEHSTLGPGTSLQKFKLSIESFILGYAMEYSVAGDKNTFNFSKLPDVGAGKEDFEEHIENFLCFIVIAFSLVKFLTIFLSIHLSIRLKSNYQK